MIGPFTANHSVKPLSSISNLFIIQSLYLNLKLLLILIIPLTEMKQPEHSELPKTGGHFLTV